MGPHDEQRATDDSGWAENLYGTAICEVGFSSDLPQICPTLLPETPAAPDEVAECRDGRRGVGGIKSNSCGCAGCECWGQAGCRRDRPAPFGLLREVPFGAKAEGGF